jgi:hypothetical protein
MNVYLKNKNTIAALFVTKLRTNKSTNKTTWDVKRNKVDHILLTHSLMELSPSWEAANCAATQELPSILWNPKVHYRVHKSPALIPILNQINPVHTIPSHPISLKSILILSTHLRLGLPSGSFLLAFPPISYIYSSSPHSCYMPCLSHPPWLDHSNYTWRSVQVMKLLVMQLSPISSHFIRPYLTKPKRLTCCLQSLAPDSPKLMGNATDLPCRLAHGPSTLSEGTRIRNNIRTTGPGKLSQVVPVLN